MNKKLDTILFLKQKLLLMKDDLNRMINLPDQDTIPVINNNYYSTRLSNHSISNASTLIIDKQNQQIIAQSRVMDRKQTPRFQKTKENQGKVICKKQKKINQKRFQILSNTQLSLRHPLSNTQVQNRLAFETPKRINKKQSIYIERSQSPSRKSQKRFSKYFRQY